MRRLSVLVLFVVAIGVAGIAMALAVGKTRGFEEFMGQSFPLRRVIVKGHFDHISTEKVREIIAAKAGSGFFLADITAMRRAVNGLPWVRTVTIRREWPDTLVLRLEEQHAVARLGDKGLLNDAGRPFYPELIREDELSRLPRVEAVLHTGHSIDVALLERLQGHLGRIGRQLRVFVLNPRGALRLELDSGLVLRLGREEQEQRLERFVHFYPRLEARIEPSVGVVDLRYDNGLAVGPARSGQG